MLTLTPESVYDHICWSADVEDELTLLGHLDRMPKLRVIKIDRLFVARNGYNIIHVLNDRGLKVFYDAKLVEIPPKLEALAQTECAHAPWMLNCMAESVSNGQFALTGELTRDDLDGLKRFADACHEANVRPCGVTVLTTETNEVVADEYNGRSRVEQVLYYVGVLKDAGFTDVVCSPKEVPAIRAESQFNELDLDTPGVRPAGAKKDDQVNANTPRATFEAGSNLLIIGRPITTGDPAENLDRLAAECLEPAA